jgi:hypothetical protein
MHVGVRADPLTVAPARIAYPPYRKTLGDPIDRYTITYPGALEAVVIENEVDARATFYSGMAADYLAELAAGCEVAHARGVRCTDSGLGSTSMLLLLADYYETAGGALADRHDGNVSSAASSPQIPASTTRTSLLSVAVKDRRRREGDRMVRPPRASRGARSRSRSASRGGGGRGPAPAA